MLLNIGTFGLISRRMPKVGSHLILYVHTAEFSNRLGKAWNHFTSYPLLENIHSTSYTEDLQTQWDLKEKNPSTLQETSWRHTMETAIPLTAISVISNGQLLPSAYYVLGVLISILSG